MLSLETHKTKIVSKKFSLNNSDQIKQDRSKILEHSRKKFHAEGFYKTSMDEIAKDLHISKKTIYKHFPSKEELLRAITNDTTFIIKNKIVKGDIALLNGKKYEWNKKIYIWIWF